MEKDNNIGLIEDAVAGKSFRLAGISNRKGYNLKKIFVGDNLSDNWVRQQFPATEIVQDINSIINDKDIDLIIIPGSRKEELNVVADILHTGKNLRIV